MVNALVKNGDESQHYCPLGRNRNIVVGGRIGGRLCLFLTSVIPVPFCLHADSETFQAHRVSCVMDQTENDTTEK